MSMPFPVRLAPRGFTLVELMIVVAIVAILATVAYPSYMRFITKSNRDEAKSSLQRITLIQEAWRRERGTFASGTDLATPLASLRRAELYEYSVTAANRTGYTIVATAIGRQAAREAAYLSGTCDTLRLEVTLGNVTRAPAACW